MYSLQQLNKYLDMDDDEECLAFWHRNKSTLNKLVHPALRALSILYLQIVLPLSESLDRVHGVILSPHRTRMSDSLVSQLIFLKCNKSLLLNIPYVWTTVFYVQVSVFGTICSS